MLKNFVRSSVWIAIAFCCARHMSYAQGVDPTVKDPFPAGSALINIAPDADGNLTIGGEYKQPKNVVEPEKPVFWTWYTDVGYESEYNFRGTNLTPDADGAGFINVQVTKWNFTLGLFGIHQFGNAEANSWSIGESGGSAAANGSAIFTAGVPVEILRFPKTTQNRFNELDVFLSYKFSLGPIDVTVGNIAFFIDRKAFTIERDFIATPGFIWNSGIPGSNGRNLFLGPEETVEDEQFDRIYVRLSTTKISKYIVPQITYYQTLLSDGSQPESRRFVTTPANEHSNPPTPSFVLPYLLPFNERNEALGGYLEGRINGHFPITRWMDFNPYGLVSVSFRDRTEPGGSNPFGGHPLTGWNHVETGAQLPIHLAHLGGFSSTPWAPPDADFYFVPFVGYAYHISNPTPGTDRDEWWGGAKFEVTF
jgi:hypothetical protein